jgi:predicted phage terminase large subunit-like protein
MTRTDAVNFLIKKPYKFGHLLGFTKLNAMHNVWMIKMLKSKKDETLQAHRGSYKTTCVSVILAILIILLPNKRILFMRKTDSDVKEIIKQVQNILLDPHTQVFVQTIYGVSLKLTVASATEINTNLTTDVKGTSQLVGIGTGASLTGKHFDIIFTDDIVNVKDRTSKAERDQTKIIYQELQNIKNRGGRIFNTGTPWHKDDAFSLMPDPEKWDYKQTGLISDDEIEHIKSHMTNSLFAANYELRHVAAEDVLFWDPQTGGDPLMIQQGDAHIDAAYGGEDWTAFTIINKQLIDGKYKYFVLGKCWRKHVDDVIDQCVALYNKYMCNKLYNETNGDKGYLNKDLKKRGVRSIPYHEDMNKFLKISTYLKNVWADVIFVNGTDPDYINQICDYNEDAEHDDCPDSLASLIRKKWGMKVHTEEEKAKLMFL